MTSPDREVADVLAVLGSPGTGHSEPLAIAQQLIEVLPVPIFFKGRDGAYLGVNAAWEEFFGVARATMIGAHARELYVHAPAIGERHREMDEALWLAPGRQSYEITLPMRDGTTRHTIYYKATFTRAGGEVGGLIGTIVDITDRKRAEQREAIENAIARHLGSEGSLHDAIRGILRVMCERLEWACGARWSLDEADNRLRCQETWGEDIPGVRAFLDSSAQATFTPGRQGLIREVLATGRSVWIDDVTRRPDFLRARIAETAGLRGGFALPVLLGDRVLGAIEFFSHDARHPDKWLLQTSTAVGTQIGQLMARREAEEALRESEARFRGLTELSSDWYWEQDEDLRFTLIQVGLRGHALPTHDYLGKRRWDHDLIGISPAQLGAHQADLAARRPFHDFEYGRRDERGGIQYVSVSGRPVFDAAGAFRGYRGVGKDITARKRAEEALREANLTLELKARELARSNEDLQQFAYVASHDLQEPLRMVSSYTQLLERRYREHLDGDAREFMHFIVDGAARMKQLIEDLLEYSRVGSRPREHGPVDTARVLDKALANLRAAIEASGAAVTRGDMPSVTGDPAQLAQLFQNLVANAIKFRGADAPRVHVEGEERRDVWLFAVKDNGIGLDPQYAERVFMMFQRLHNRSDYPGTGIGLAICKKIVERHGGRIWVESAAGRGAIFRFTLARAPQVQ